MVYNINDNLDVQYEDTAVVNEGDHWYGYRRIDGEMINLDSL